MRTPSLRRLAGGGLLLASLFSAALLAQPAAAQTPGWTALSGPAFPAAEHAIVWQLAADPGQPSDLLAATSRGVYSSTDGGSVWSPTSITAWTWTVAFADGGATAYAGTESAGVYRSTDQGTTWSRDDLGLGNLDVRAIAVAPNAIVLGTNSGVYLGGSGVGWEPVGLQGTTISSVAVTVESPLGVLAGSDSTVATSNLFINLAVGKATSWQSITGGDPQGSPVFAIGAGPLARGASHPPILVGTLKGLFRSVDGGGSWQQVNLAQGAMWSVNAIAFDPENPAVVYVGGDNGGSSGGGLQRSLNGGSSWQVWQAGLPASDVTGLQVEPTSPVTVLAALWHGSSREPATAKLVDTSAPGPVPLQAVGATSPIPISPPPTAAPTTRPNSRPGPDGRAGLSVPAWAPPLIAAFVVILLVGIFMALRRRRIRLDAEAPP